LAQDTDAHDPPSPHPAQLNSSARQFHTIFAAHSDPATLRGGACWVDVRDLARAHVLSLLKAEAGGERFIVSAGAYVWQEWCTFRFIRPDPDSTSRTSGNEGAGGRKFGIMASASTAFPAGPAAIA
jgi:hypothetical protein